MLFGAYEKNSISTNACLGTFFSAVAGTQLVNLGRANPFARIPAPVHPKITILSPEDNTLHASNVLTVNFNVSINFEKGWSYISYVNYKASWQQDKITVYEWRTNDSAPQFLSEFTYKLNLTGIPEGNQTVIINAGGHGGYNEGIYNSLYIFERCIQFHLHKFHYRQRIYFVTTKQNIRYIRCSFAFHKYTNLLYTSRIAWMDKIRLWFLETQL